MEVRKRAATAVHPEPRVKWQLKYLVAAAKEARKFLTPEQYGHVVHLVVALAGEDDPRRSTTQDVRPFDEFLELRDKGGLLGRINVRVYFAVLDEPKTILVLACYKKEDDGRVPTYMVAKVRNRFRAAQEACGQS